MTNPANLALGHSLNILARILSRDSRGSPREKYRGFQGIDSLDSEAQGKYRGSLSIPGKVSGKAHGITGNPWNPRKSTGESRERHKGLQGKVQGF